MRDDGSVTLLRVVKGRHSEVSTRNGHERTHRNKRKPKRRSRGKKQPMMGKNENITVLPPLSPLLPMRQIIPAIMMNERGWRGYLISHSLHHPLELEVVPLWFIPNSTYIQTMCPSKRHSRMPCKTNSLKRKDRQVRYRCKTNRS